MLKYLASLAGYRRVAKVAALRKLGKCVCTRKSCQDTSDGGAVRIYYEVLVNRIQGVDNAMGPPPPLLRQSTP
jgi:hypothetical protein